MKDKPKLGKEQTLSEAFEELEGITAEFEEGKVGLEEGVPKFERGLELAKKLKDRLSKIENEINEIKVRFKDVEEPVVQEVESALEPESESEPEEIDSEQIPF